MATAGSPAQGILVTRVTVRASGFPLPIKNYNDLRREMLVPSILVVLVLPKNPSHWLETTEECMIRHSPFLQ